MPKIRMSLPSVNSLINALESHHSQSLGLALERVLELRVLVTQVSTVSWFLISFANHVVHHCFGQNRSFSV